MDMIKLLTLKEVSELLGSKDPKGRMVRELRRKGILPGAKIAGRLLFREQDVIDYIEKQFAIQNPRVNLRKR